MKLKGRRQSTNIEDRRVERDITKPRSTQGTTPDSADPTVVGKGRMLLDRYNARTATIPMLDLYKPLPKKKAKF